MKQAAVAYIERGDGLILVVWNMRYGGFTLPGGMVEEGETAIEAMVRETREETSVEVLRSDLLFEQAHTEFSRDPGRQSNVTFFRAVHWRGEPKEMEQACPVTWLTRDQYLDWTPFPAFYAKVFPRIKPLAAERT